jgi:ketosteroid isomerase-like protein
MSATIDEVKALEDRRYAAMIAADVAEMEELFADTLRYTHSHSGIDTKRSFIEMLTSGNFAYRSVRRLTEEYLEYDDTVIISTHVNLDITVGDTERLINSRATVTWARTGGRWQFVAWQSTPMAS